MKSGEAMLQAVYRRSEWIYDWKRTPGSRFRSWLATLIVAGLFFLLVISLRVSTIKPVEWVAPGAAVIQLGDDESSRLLAMQAAAQGPFPSRFKPAEWQGAASLERLVDDATRVVPQQHVSHLQPFPTPSAKPARLAKRGEPVMPARPLGPLYAPADVTLEMVPFIVGVAGIDDGPLPKKLPVWDGPVAERTAAQSWRYMLQIAPSGHVRDCVAMIGGEGLAPAEVERWLRGVVFEADGDRQGMRWAAVEVVFRNQEVKHGADTQ